MPAAIRRRSNPEPTESVPDEIPVSAPISRAPPAAPAPAQYAPAQAMSFQEQMQLLQMQSAQANLQLQQEQLRAAQRANTPRTTQTVQRAPITSMIGQFRAQVQEMHAAQDALADLAGPPKINPYMTFLNSPMAAELGKTVSSVGVELVRMYKDERAMKRASKDLDDYQKKLERIYQMHNDAINLRAQNPQAAAGIDPPPAPQLNGIPQFPGNISGQAGQSINMANQLSQAYGGMPPGVAPTWATPTPAQPDMGQTQSPFGQTPVMGVSRPRVSVQSDSGMMGVGVAPSFQFPGAPQPPTQEQLLAQIEQLRQEKANLEDRLQITKIQQSNPAPRPQIDSDGVEGEGVAPEYLNASNHGVPQENPKRDPPKDQ
jgi:hypothetical protein